MTDLDDIKLTSIKKWVSLIIIFSMTFIIIFFSCVTFFGVINEVLNLIFSDSIIYRTIINYAPICLSILLILLSVNYFLRKNIKTLVLENLELNSEIEEIDLNKESNDLVAEKLRKAFINAKKNLNLSDDVILIRSKENIFNAFAISNLNGKAVVVFDGLSKDISFEELQAVIGHELGHILNKDSLHKMIDFSIVYFVPYIEYGTNLLSVKLFNLLSRVPITVFFTFPLLIAVKIIFFIIRGLNWLLNFVRSYASKQAEHLADYAGMISSPENSMINALEVIKNIEDVKKTNDSILMKLLAEHPKTEKRISYLKNIS